MRKITICMLVSILSLFLPLLLSAAQTKGMKVVIKDTSGRKVGLYKGSYALLIGVSNYTAGWPKLHSVPNEINQVEAVLQTQGFHVVKVMNPTSDTLREVFEDFINDYGFDQDNRLLFFFSGHGHTRKDGQKGYLVPTDAPNPHKDTVGFLRKALPMNQILAWSRQVEAKHALFLFDSCFSGTVFKAKDLPERPPHISRATALPVRQYITAGDAGEKVPAKSVFTPAFIDALEYNWGDLNRDGYVSGTELGLYLQEKVPQHSNQNPQYGKIRDYELARGDFIFALKSSSPPTKSYDRFREERKQLEREKRELEQLKVEIERKRLEEQRKHLEAEKKKLDIAKLPRSQNSHLLFLLCQKMEKLPVMVVSLLILTERSWTQKPSSCGQARTLGRIPHFIRMLRVIVRDIGGVDTRTGVCPPLTSWRPFTMKT